MKNLIFIAFAAFVLFITACHPDKCCVPPGSTDYITAQKDSVLWDANPASTTVNNDTVTIVGQTNNPGALQETLVIKVIYNGLGNYNLTNGQAVYYTTAGQSAPVIKHDIDTLFANSLNIFFYAPGNIVGTFNLKFMNTPPSTKDIAFLEGTFEIPLHK